MAKRSKPIKPIHIHLVIEKELMLEIYRLQEVQKVRVSRSEIIRRLLQAGLDGMVKQKAAA